jgi:hypothetical protein
MTEPAIGSPTQTRTVRDEEHRQLVLGDSELALETIIHGLFAVMQENGMHYVSESQLHKHFGIFMKYLRRGGLINDRGLFLRDSSSGIWNALDEAIFQAVYVRFALMKLNFPQESKAVERASIYFIRRFQWDLQRGP